VWYILAHDAITRQLQVNLRGLEKGAGKMPAEPAGGTPAPRGAGPRASINPSICSDLQPAGEPGILPGFGSRTRPSVRKNARKE
jgi:hypothetical protein